MKNPLGFPWEIGQYKNPNIVVPPGGPAPQPFQLPCPGSTVIYAADIARVANCQGFVGFGGGNPWANPIFQNALVNAAKYAPKVKCANPCTWVVSIIWIGWNCGNQPPVATAAVEIEVQCVLPNPDAITAFKDACRGLDELPAPIFLGKGWLPPKKQKEPTHKKRKPKTG